MVRVSRRGVLAGSVRRSRMGGLTLATLTRHPLPHQSSSPGMSCCTGMSQEMLSHVVADAMSAPRSLSRSGYQLAVLLIGACCLMPLQTGIARADANPQVSLTLVSSPPSSAKDLTTQFHHGKASAGQNTTRIYSMQPKPAPTGSSQLRVVLPSEVNHLDQI